MKVIYICLLILCAPFVNAINVAGEKSPLVERSQSSSSQPLLQEVTPAINDATERDYGTLTKTLAIKENDFHLDPIPGITPAGQQMVEQTISYYLNGLTESERALVIRHLMDSNFTVTHVWHYCWQIVAGICEPLGELAKLGVVVTSLWPNWKSEDSEYSKRFADMTGAVTAGLGIASLLFGKISGYAADKVRSWERIINCLKALKDRAPGEGNV